MKYSELRSQIQSGDLALITGFCGLSFLVRLATARSTSHVAVFVWIESGLWVAEMHERRGYRLTPATLWISDRLDDGAEISLALSPWFGEKSQPVTKAVNAWRHHRYSKFHAFMAWVAIWIPALTIRYPSICSGFASHVWQAAGSKQEYRTPGDFERAASSRIPITELGE